MNITSTFEHIKTNLLKMDIDEIRELIWKEIDGMEIHTPVIPAGTTLYRARKFDPYFNKSSNIYLKDIKHPPPSRTKLGRVNRAGKPMFYCSISKEPVFFEMQNLFNDDELVLSFWETTTDLLVNNIGYTQYVFDKIGTTRLCPTWITNTNDSSQEIILSENNISEKDKNNTLLETISDIFMQEVLAGEEHHYKLTVALAEIYLKKIMGSKAQFNGIIYPSVRMSANGDNLALKPEFAENNLKFKKASHIRIDNKGEKEFAITKLDEAINLDKNESLNWLGRTLNWTLNRNFQELQATVTPGRDRHGDYELNKNGTPSHWCVKDVQTGEVIEPC